MMYVVLMGAPGAGKGTQARKLQDELGLPQVATGDLFRENLRLQTELGQLAQQYMNAGELVPDQVTVAMVRERLSRQDCSRGAILDGFPRTPAQAAALDELLAEMKTKINIVPHIHVGREDLIRRLLKRAEIEGRADDNEETIRRRMSVYEEQTQPLLDYYDERDLLVEINGEQAIDEVFSELLEAVKNAT